MTIFDRSSRRAILLMPDYISGLHWLRFFRRYCFIFWLFLNLSTAPAYSDSLAEGISEPESSEVATTSEFEQRELVETISVDMARAILENEGYSVELDQEGGIIWTIEGYRTYVLVPEDGASLIFYSGFKNDGDVAMTLGRVNLWNQNNRFSRSFVDQDGHPILRLDLDLAGGVTVDRIADFYKTCRIAFKKWLSDVVE